MNGIANATTTSTTFTGETERIEIDQLIQIRHISPKVDWLHVCCKIEFGFTANKKSLQSVFVQLFMT